MEFLKKHYEKLILSVVLLGLAAVAATLPMKVNEEKQKEEDRKNSLIGAKVEPLKPVDLTTNQAVLAKVKTPIRFDIAGKHNLFNPVPWVEKQGGELQKLPGGGAAGMAALEVTAVTPLQMIVSFDEVIPTTGANGTNEYKYNITVIREGATSSPKQSRAMNKGMTAGGVGTLKDVQGPPEAPTALVLTLPDRTDITISKEKPFTRIIGYAADLYNGITQPPYARKAAKVGDTIAFGTDAYLITLIDTNGVVLRDKKTQKQFTKPVANPK
jgi:hypothetical protein